MNMGISIECLVKPPCKNEEKYLTLLCYLNPILIGKLSEIEYSVSHTT